MPRIRKNCTPLCLMPNGSLISYQYGHIVVSRREAFISSFFLPIEKKNKIFGHSKILTRFLRLGIRAAIAIDDSSVIISLGNTLRELNVNTGELSNGFICADGVRPLTFTQISGIRGFEDGVYFGGYVHNFDKNPVSVYHRVGVDNWNVVYTFPKGAINHVHNVIADSYRQCLWILTGDFGDSAAIWKVSDGFKKVERFVSGDQKWRGCVAFAVPEGLLYATDAPFAKNHVYFLQEDGTSTVIGDLSGSCIYGCQWKDKYVFSTVVEPDGRDETFLKLMFGWKRGSGIEDNYARIYLGDYKEGFKEIYKEKKDIYPFIFQFGTFKFPFGLNDTEWLYFQPIATASNDMDLVEIQID